MFAEIENFSSLCQRICQKSARKESFSKEVSEMLEKALQADVKVSNVQKM
jgi:hypothetical protein